MKPALSHRWDLTSREATALQRELAGQIRSSGEPPQTPCYIAGCDASGAGRWAQGTEQIIAGVMIFEFPGLERVDQAFATGKSPFPYIPGLLSFREAPLYEKAFGKLKIRPDLLLCDGQGIAHPRRLGLASHLGLLFDLPSIGVAKSRLVGSYREPGPRRGNSTRLTDKGEVIGKVLRTRDQVKPLFISPGHRIGIDEAVKMVLATGAGFRLPEPTRLTDQWVGRLRRAALDSDRAS